MYLLTAKFTGRCWENLDLFLKEWISFSGERMGLYLKNKQTNSEILCIEHLDMKSFNAAKG